MTHSPKTCTPAPEHKNLNRWRWFHLLPIFVSIFCAIAMKWFASRNTGNALNRQSLENQIHVLENKLLKPDPHLYLIWTTPQSTFKERNYNVLEAYFYHHPGAKITLLANHLFPDMFARFTDAGYDLSIERVDDAYLHKLSQSCPGKEWMDNLERWKKGPFYYSHITDYIRFCVLYQHGGIYSDFDAILLNPIKHLKNFIGRDTSGAHGKCKWCLPGGDAYLAPGVMGSTRGHSLPKNALEIGFGRAYDPDIFNQVGPMAVTKAYKRDARGVNILEQKAFYPFNYLNSWKLLESTEDALAKLERIRRQSLSLHLYGHKTRNLAIQKSSIVSEATELFRVTKLMSMDSPYTLRVPKFMEITNGAQSFQDVRILTNSANGMDFALDLQLDVLAKHGKLMMAGAEDSKWTSSLQLHASSPAAMNIQLLKLIYVPQGLIKGRDTLSFRFSVKDDRSMIMPLQMYQIPIYDLSHLVTILVKTVGRMDKVFELVKSCSQMYPQIPIIVSDDAENITKSEGQRKMFYYLPLPRDVGLSAGRNRMVQMVKSDYFLTLDDDFTCDANSELGVLVHALETPNVITGTRYDIAAAKNPVDEAKFELDFCGFLRIDGTTLHLEPGYHEAHQGCHSVEFVPNLFVGRTSLFKDKLKWDENLKLGEHEDFFLRAKRMGIKVLTCPSSSFQHNQVEHWLKKTNYDRMRNRVYDFWKESLRKHNLTRLVSFGTTMMDLTKPPPVSSISYSNLLAKSLQLSWISEGLSCHIMMSRDQGRSFKYVNYGQGEGFEGRGPLTIFPLRPGTEYIFKLIAGNRFEYEDIGKTIELKTLSRSQEREINLLENASFENGHPHFKAAMATMFQMIESETTMDGRFVGRTQVSTRSYLSRSVTQTAIQREIPGKKVYDFLEKRCSNHTLLEPCSTRPRTLSFAAHSKLEGAHFTPDLYWGVELWIRLTDGTILKEKGDFDRSHTEWQISFVQICLSDRSQIASVHALGTFGAVRGAVLWDDWVLVTN